MEQYEFTDYAGDRLLVRSLDEQAAAVIETTFRDTVDGQPVMVPAHRLAEVVAAMYEAAGQPVPVLPVIPDPVQVTRLADALCKALDQVPFPPYSGDSARAAARLLLAHGVRLPEATDG